MYYNIASSERNLIKVNDIIFPSGCEACTINLGNKDMKISIYTGATSVRLKNIFTDISQYPTGKHEIDKKNLLQTIIDKSEIVLIFGIS